MPSLSTTYACPACRAESRVTVENLDEPSTAVQENGKVILLPADEARRRIEAGTVRAIAGVELATLEQAARERLRYATCPRCQQQNPEGLDIQRAEARSGRHLSLGLVVVIAVGARFYPRVALLAPALSLLLTGLGVIARRRAGLPARTGAVVLSTITPLALAAAIFMYPSYAPLAPILLIGPAVFLASPSVQQRWKETAESLRFEG